ncbi:Apocarotenoid-15,15'-oxygenase [Seminavis robusta]|uniref:Apocarotenoid-15,15'-oxygenase n=1 Tax=Seminavis robusta TaxID=568900 RepID=A0A9N8GZY7_9STRA|nr:Apocarotenoid-15,15'-oxygenase [Seminavis robusta]|eukprot:Sro11_g008590.1 Apocarotenoid-15,15'-oxygenase (668) ;mRNA; f:91930-94135
MIVPRIALLAAALTSTCSVVAFAPHTSTTCTIGRSQSRLSTTRASVSLDTPQNSEDVNTSSSSTSTNDNNNGAANNNNGPDMEAYSNGYATVFEELPYKECKPIDGKIPDDLIGTYFRSGPAMFTAGSIVPPKQSLVQPKTQPVPDGADMDRMVSHPFEGDGAILGVTFSAGATNTASTRFRFVRTAGFTNERKKGKRLYAAMDSTRELGPQAAMGLGNDLALPLYRHHLQPGLNKQRKNTSNSRAFYWGKRLITMWEGGLPYKLDGLALSTEGRSQLGGVLQETDPFGGKGVIDSKAQRALFYSVNQNPKSSDVTLYEFNENFRPVQEKGGKVQTSFSGFAMISDFGVTENYAVFVQPNTVANGMQYMFNKEPGKVVALEKGPSTLHLVARVTSSKPSKSFPIPTDGAAADAELQFCNAYEDDTGRVVLDAIRSDGSNLSGSSTAPKWPWASSLAQYTATTPKKSLWRYVVDPKSGVVEKELLSNLQCSFGVVNPAVSAQKHRYIYTTIGAMGSEVAPPQGIAKFDCETKETQTWMPNDNEFCGEPMFATRQGASQDEEDDGYILSVMYNGSAKESELIILAAKDIAAGPIARIPLGVAVPHGLFGCFTDAEEARWDGDTIDRRAKLADKMESKGNMWNEVKITAPVAGVRNWSRRLSQHDRCNGY